jgi:hypothetical protein
MTRIEKINAAIEELKKNNIPADEWRIDTAKSGMGFPRLYVPRKFQTTIAKFIFSVNIKFYGDYIYG